MNTAVVNTAAALLLLAACAAPPAAPEPPVPVCPGGPSLPPFGATVALRIWRSEAVAPGVVDAELAEAAAYWRRYGLAFDVSFAGTVPETSLLGADPTAERAALTAAGLDPDAPAARAEAGRAVLPVMLNPVRTFLTAHATPQVQVVLLPEVVNGASLLTKGGLVATRGLTFRHGADAALDEALPASGPLVLIGTTIPAHRGASTLAHELGHALGLSHDPRPANLMYDGGSACVPWMDAAQHHAMGAALSALDRAAGAAARDTKKDG